MRVCVRRGGRRQNGILQPGLYARCRTRVQCVSRVGGCEPSFQIRSRITHLPVACTFRSVRRPPLHPTFQDSILKRISALPGTCSRSVPPHGNPAAKTRFPRGRCCRGSRRYGTDLAPGFTSAVTDASPREPPPASRERGYTEPSTQSVRGRWKEQLDGHCLTRGKSTQQVHPHLAAVFKRDCSEFLNTIPRNHGTTASAGWKRPLRASSAAVFHRCERSRVSRLHS